MQSKSVQRRKKKRGPHDSAHDCGASGKASVRLCIRIRSVVMRQYDQCRMMNQIRSRMHNRTGPERQALRLPKTLALPPRLFSTVIVQARFKAACVAE